MVYVDFPLVFELLLLNLPASVLLFNLKRRSYARVLMIYTKY